MWIYLTDYPHIKRNVSIPLWAQPSIQTFSTCLWYILRKHKSSKGGSQPVVREPEVILHRLPMFKQKLKWNPWKLNKSIYTANRTQGYADPLHPYRRYHLVSSPEAPAYNRGNTIRPGTSGMQFANLKLPIGCLLNFFLLRIFIFFLRGLGVHLHIFFGHLFTVLLVFL